MTFTKKVTLGLAAASAVLVLVAVLSYLSLLNNSEDRRWVTHTYQVLEKLDAVRINMTDAETGERGYILTGNDSFLDPYKKGLGQIHQNMADLRALTSDNPNQQRALDRLTPIVGARLGELGERIEVRRRQGLAAGVTAVREGAGKDFMDQNSALIGTMKTEEDRLLARRSAELEMS